MKTLPFLTFLALAVPAAAVAQTAPARPKPTPAKAGAARPAPTTKVKVKLKPAPASAPVAAPATEAISATGAMAPGQPGDNSNASEPYAALITEKLLSRHLNVLASDEYEGRETGEKGQHLAAAYVAQQFKDAGLNGPLTKTPAPYLQSFKLEHATWAANPSLKAGGTSYRWLVDFYGRGDAGFAQETTVQPVFVGYGIEQDGYSDYRDRNVAGKDLLVLEGEPTGADLVPVLGSGGNPSEWGQNYRAKLALATAKGARSVFFVNFNPRSNFAKLAGRLAPTIAKPSIGLAGGKPDYIPAFFISPAVGYQVLGTSEKEILAYEAEIGRTKQPVAAAFKPGKFTIKAARTRTPFGTENALGFVPGRDKASEVLVLSAHHDHLGIVDGKIYHGADDDGSGTAALIAMAQAFGQAQKEGHGPRRSLLFLSVTGEEEGLFGSEYYTNHPVFPLANTVADLNVDMVGRTDAEHEGRADYVYVIGSDKLASQLRTVVETQNAEHEHLELDYRFDDPADPNRFYYRSDHYNFAVKRIPVAFFFNGVHDDYHQPTDTVDKIQFDKMAKRARLVFYTAWELANREERLVVDSNKQ